MGEIFALVREYGLAVVFVNLLLAQGGLPVPSYPVLLVAGALSLSGGPALPLVLLAAVAGTLVADTSWYSFGRTSGRGVLAMLCRMSLSPDSCVRQTENVYTRVGPLALLVAKFVPGLGTVAATLAGITRVRFALFVLLDTVGATLYTGLPILLGRLFHSAVEAILDTLTRLGEYGIAVVASALALYLSARWVERQLSIRRLRMGRISVEELAAMLGRGENPVILDVRSRQARRDGIIPGAFAAHHEDIEALKARLSKDAELVTYCACPGEAGAAIAARHLQRAGFHNIRPLLGGIDAWVEAGYPIATAEQA